MNRIWWLAAVVFVLAGCTGGGTQETAGTPARVTAPPSAAAPAAEEAAPAPGTETGAARPATTRTAGNARHDAVTRATAQQWRDTAPAQPLPRAPRPGTVCPVMNSPVTNSAYYVDHAGKRIWLCCAHCVDIVKSDPARYAAHGQ